MNTTRLKSTLGALLAFLVAYGPEVVTWVGGMASAPQWLRDVAKGLGIVIGLLTSKEGVLLLNKMVPAPTPNAGALPVRTGVGQGGFATIQAMVVGFCIAAATTLTLCLVLSGCHNVTPDQFLNATVDCTKTNPEASAELGAVTTCLMGAVAQNPAVCLTGLITDGHFAVDEIACLVAYVAQQNQAKVATGRYTDDDLRARQAANDFLAKEHISIRNSYQGQ
jgi:hypothetical protein